MAAAFCLMQKTSIDKAMYYDACPTRSYCGLFYFPSMRTTPCYEAFRSWNELAKLGTSVPVSVKAAGVYVAAAKCGGKRAFLIANPGDAAVDVDVRATGADGAGFTLYRVDADHAKLTADGAWTGSMITVPANGLVLALSGVELGGTAVEATAHGPANGLQQK